VCDDILDPVYHRCGAVLYIEFLFLFLFPTARSPGMNYRACSRGMEMDGSFAKEGSAV